MFNLKQKDLLNIGQRGEKAAAIYLKKQGYKILETNFTNQTGRRLGEIDIIAQEGTEIVFVEVKTRNNFSQDLSLPEENISAAKLYKLNKIASFYINSKKLFAVPYRFDAITVLSDAKNNTAKLRHLKSIFF